MLHVPAWLTWLIALALPVILLIVLKVWGADEPGNMVVHEQEDEPPDTGDRAGPDDVLIAA